MKGLFVILAAVFFAAALADNDHHYNALETLVYREVSSILHANSAISIDDCTMMCDDMFDLINKADEQHTDTMCMHYCSCEKHRNCNNHN